MFFRIFEFCWESKACSDVWMIALRHQQWVYRVAFGLILSAAHLSLLLSTGLLQLLQPFLLFLETSLGLCPPWHPLPSFSQLVPSSLLGLCFLYHCTSLLYYLTLLCLSSSFFIAFAPQHFACLFIIVYLPQLKWDLWDQEHCFWSPRTVSPAHWGGSLVFGE